MSFQSVSASAWLIDNRDLQRGILESWLHASLVGTLLQMALGPSTRAGATYSFTGNQTLYAQWTPDTYVVHTITYNGATVRPIRRLNASESAHCALLSRLQPAFSNFLGQQLYWLEYGGKWFWRCILIGATYSYSSNINLYAQWTLNRRSPYCHVY